MKAERFRLRSGRSKRKKVHVTFSIPEDVNTLLHSIIEKRGLSDFATRALEKALEEEQQILRKAYENANHDPDRNAVINDWTGLDTEGWNE